MEIHQLLESKLAVSSSPSRGKCPEGIYVDVKTTI